jgi:alpha-tubulin suppressor-like RCC1 family protein
MEKGPSLLSCGSVYNGCLLQHHLSTKEEKENDILELKEVNPELALDCLKKDTTQLTLSTKFCIAFESENHEIYVWGETMNPESDTGKEEVIESPVKFKFFMPSHEISQVRCGFDHCMFFSFNEQKVYGYGKNSFG